MWDSLVLTTRSYQNINARLHLRTARGQIPLKIAVWVFLFFFFFIHPRQTCSTPPLHLEYAEKGRMPLKPAVRPAHLINSHLHLRTAWVGREPSDHFDLGFSFPFLPFLRRTGSTPHCIYNMQRRGGYHWKWPFDQHVLPYFLMGLPLGTSQRMTAPFVCFVLRFKGEERKEKICILFQCNE